MEKETDVSKLTVHELCQEIRKRGCAVSVFSQKELNGVSPREIEGVMVTAGVDRLENISKQ